MGAEFNFTELKVKTEKAAIKAGREVIEQALYDYGHAGYSGSFAEADGVEVVKHYTPANLAEAEKWLDENAAKWGPALIVRCADGTWCMGAICSS